MYLRSGVGFVASRVGQEPSERSSWCDGAAAKHRYAALVMSNGVGDINGAALPKLCRETPELCWKLMVEVVTPSAERYPVCDVVSQARIDMSADNVRGVEVLRRAAVLAHPTVPLHYCSCPTLIFVHRLYSFILSMGSRADERSF